MIDTYSSYLAEEIDIRIAENMWEATGKKPLENWNNKLVKFSKVVYPQSLDSNTPQNYFLAIFCGARGSGKTFLLTKLLKTLEEKKIYENGKAIPQRIILICSTAHSDSNKVFKSLKNLDWEQDVITDYSDIALTDKMTELKKDITDYKDYKAYREAWTSFLKKKVEDLTEEEMLLLDKYKFIEFKEFPKPKFPDGFIIHWICDDMLGQSIFKQGKSPFTNLCIRNRHVIPGNIIISTQSMMAIPKTIRLNANLIVMFKFANKQSVINDIYPVVSAYITEEQLTELYEYATEEPHDALVIDGTHGKIVFKKNFDKLLSFSSDTVHEV